MAAKKDYGFGLFVDPGFKAAYDTLRDLAKLILDLLRNLIVVGLLFVISEKSGKWYATLLAWIGFFSLWTYMSSYWGALAFRFPKSTSIWLKCLIFLVAFVLVGAFTVGFTTALQSTVVELARVQQAR